MSIAQRKDGRYLVKYKVNETWKQKSFKTREEAEQFEADTHLDEATSGRMTVGELMTAFFRNNKRHQSTVRQTVACLCGHKHKRLGTISGGEGRFLFDRYVDSLNRKDLEALREAYRVRGCKNTTINVAVSHIKGILSWGFEQELISVNPWKDYKALHKEKNAIDVSLDIYRAIYAVAQPWLQWAMKTAFCCCLRFGNVELFGLQWKNFDFKQGNVTIKQGKSGLPKTVYPPMPYMEEAQQRFMDDQKHGYELVCRSQRNKKVTYYSHRWHETCAKAGVFMRPYDIRHLAATTMIASGVDIASVASQLGHTNCHTTGKFYIHATPSGIRKASNALAIV